MKYSIIVICESCGDTTADTNEIVNDFENKFVELFKTEVAATSAVLASLSHAEWDGATCFVSVPSDSAIKEQYFEACEYAFRDWMFGQPDGLMITIGVGTE